MPQDDATRTGHRWARQHATGQQWGAGAQERHCKQGEASKPSRKQVRDRSGGRRRVEIEKEKGRSDRRAQRGREKGRRMEEGKRRKAGKDREAG